MTETEGSEQETADQNKSFWKRIFGFAAEGASAEGRHGLVRGGTVLTPFRKDRAATLAGIAGVAVFAGLLWLAFVGTGILNFGNRNVEAVFGSGLNVVPGASEVRVHGLMVGQVGGVELRDGQVIATLSIDRDVDLREDASLVVRLKSILGEKYVDLDPGSATTPLGDRPITDVIIGADITKLSSGSPDSYELYDDLGRAEAFDMLQEVADLTAEYTPQAKDLIVDTRSLMDRVHRAQPDMFRTLDEVGLLLTLINSSPHMGTLIDRGRIVQRSLERLYDTARLDFARVDSAVKILNSLYEGNADNIELVLDRFRHVYYNAADAWFLFKAGASVPVALYGLGPLFHVDPRREGPNPFPAYPELSLPAHTEPPWASPASAPVSTSTSAPSSEQPSVSTSTSAPSSEQPSVSTSTSAPSSKQPSASESSSERSGQ